MPELPEVELARRQLERWLSGRNVVRAEADKTRIFRGGDRERFTQLKGKLSAADRRGKYLLLAFDSGEGVVAHLGMTGKFLLRAKSDEVRWSRARLFLDDDKVVHYRDPRMFGQIVAAPASTLREVKAVAKLGIDPLVDGLSVEQLEGALLRTRQPLKVALMDQTRVTGLGNIHAAEALFRARLHPGRKPQSLTDPEWKALHKGIHAALQFALDAEDDPDEIEYVEEPGAPNPFLIYGRAGTPCRRCKTPVKSFVQGGRTTHFCPSCQPRNPKKTKPVRGKR
jgi:formamidopyrimidine-DNA glycosylase